MSRPHLAIGVPFVLIGLLVSACRAIVGITDLTVDGGADATEERGRSDSGDARSDAQDAGPRADATPDAAPDAPPDVVFDTSSDAGSERSDATDAGPVRCDAQVPDEASVGRQACIQGCIDGHTLAAPAFYGASPPCVCKVCSAECEAFCAPSCPKSTPTGACRDCASHAYVDDAGACHGVEDTTCTAGCGTFATCVASCPPD